MALNARPSLQLVVKLWMFTLGYLQKSDQNSLIISSTQQDSITSRSNENSKHTQCFPHIHTVCIDSNWVAHPNRFAPIIPPIWYLVFIFKSPSAWTSTWKTDWKVCQNLILSYQTVWQPNDRLTYKWCAVLWPSVYRQSFQSVGNAVWMAFNQCN